MKQKISKYTWLVLIFTLVVSVLYPSLPVKSQTSTQYYVATNGSDSNPGTQSAPWKTIQKAMNSATAGSTVNIKGGTYYEILNVNVSGTAGAYITFRNAPSETAIIDGKGDIASGDVRGIININNKYSFEVPQLSQNASYLLGSAILSTAGENKINLGLKGSLFEFFIPETGSSIYSELK